MSVEEKLQAMGLTLPEAAKPLASYVPAVRAGNLVYVSGQLPVISNQLKWRGQVGSDVSEDDAVQAAQAAVLNCLAAIKTVVDSLDQVTRVVRVTGYVNSELGFSNQPVVVNGASDLLVQLFGDAGHHARVAIGVNALPLGAPVEIDMIVEIKE